MPHVICAHFIQLKSKTIRRWEEKNNVLRDFYSKTFCTGFPELAQLQDVALDQAALTCVDLVVFRSLSIVITHLQLDAAGSVRRPRRRWEIRRAVKCLLTEHKHWCSLGWAALKQWPHKKVDVLCTLYVCVCVCACTWNTPLGVCQEMKWWYLRFEVLNKTPNQWHSRG